MRFLTSGFIHESVSPKPLSIPVGPFQIFPKIRGDILSSKWTTGVRWHRWQMEKIFNQKNFNYLVWTPLGRRVNIYINFCLQVHLRDSVTRFFVSGFFLESVSPKPLITPLGPFRIFLKIRRDIRSSRFATGVYDTGGKWKQPLSRKFLIILFGHLWVVELTYI